MIGLLKIIGMLLVVMVLMAIAITARANEDEAPVYRYLSPDVVCVKPRAGEELCYNLQRDRDSQQDRDSHDIRNCHQLPSSDGRLLFDCTNGDPLLIATKGKTPRSRVGETFQALLPKIIGPNKQSLRLPPSSSTYLFHHDIWHTPGKAMIHKECAYDFKNDPGEASCQMVWAHI